MTYLHTITIGIVEGITEFLPVSSTAHIILSQNLFGIPVDETFTIAIQSGALLAVLGLYVKNIKTVVALFPKLIVAFVPSAVAGVLLISVLSRLDHALWLIACTLIIGGVIMICIPKNRKISSAELSAHTFSYAQCFKIGLAQMCAIIPGVSRSGAILIAGDTMQLPRKALTEFSFLLGAGTIFAATVLSVLHTHTPIQVLFSANYLLGFFVSGTVAWFSCIWLLQIIQKPDSLKYFGIYRIVLGLLVLLFLV